MPSRYATRLAVLLAFVASMRPLPATAQDALGANTVSFTTSQGTWVSLDVSKDGRSLVFELLGDLYTLPVGGGRASPLVTGRAFQSQPRFSPDGTQIVFVSDATGSDNLWIANADGTNARAITRMPRSGLLSPAWSADGRSIVVTNVDNFGSRTAELWRYDAATGQGQRLLENSNGLPSQ